MDLQFEVWDNNNPKWFYITDYTKWGVRENEPAVVEVTYPGFECPHVEYFGKNLNNGFNVNNLGVGCGDCGELSDISDGLYTITVKGSPSVYQKTVHYLRTVLAYKAIQEVYVKEGAGGDTALMMELEFLHLSAKAHVSLGEIDTGMAIFSQLSKKLSQLNCGGCV